MALDLNREFSSSELTFNINKLKDFSHLESVQGAISVAKEYVRKSQFAEARSVFSGLEKYVSVLEAKEQDKIKRAALQYPS